MLISMEPDDGRSFLLKWSRTFPDIPDREDFTGRLASDPTMFARIYFQESHPDQSARWYWTVAANVQIALGYAADARAAARAAEDAYARREAAETGESKKKPPHRGG